ncbi:MAG: hypothetical protein QM535_15780 [Limnohabitans sp.]|nr:hypothetical protein [Limnohabitans sp.]
MSKKQIFYLVLFASITILSSSFTTFRTELLPMYNTSEKTGEYTVPTEIEVGQKFFNIPFAGKTFVGFQQSLGARESLCIYDKVNTLGYLGKYQFGSDRLQALGIKDKENFLENRSLQEKAFIANLALNKWELRKEIANYSGKTVAGIPITESGILAAAHLGGVGSVKKFFKTNGNRKFKDGYGTSITEYLKQFGGYNTSFIEANKKAKAHQYVY